MKNFTNYLILLGFVAALGLSAPASAMSFSANPEAIGLQTERMIYTKDGMKKKGPKAIAIAFKAQKRSY